MGLPPGPAPGAGGRGQEQGRDSMCGAGKGGAAGRRAGRGVPAQRYPQPSSHAPLRPHPPAGPPSACRCRARSRSTPRCCTPTSCGCTPPLRTQTASTWCRSTRPAVSIRTGGSSTAALLAAAAAVAAAIGRGMCSLRPAAPSVLLLLSIHLALPILRLVLILSPLLVLLPSFSTSPTRRPVRGAEPARRVHG